MVHKNLPTFIFIPMYYSPDGPVVRLPIRAAVAERSPASAAERRRHLTICLNLLKQGALS
jgi:hypothetical protein